MTKLQPTRRDVLMGALFAGGFLMVGGVSATKALAATGEAAFGPFIRIAPDGTVTVVAKFSELGQGTHSGLAAIVAEELDADWDKVAVEAAPANAKVYGRTGFGMMMTGGSGSIVDSWMPLRKAGAAARAMFVQAAATQWGVPASEITVENGVVKHKSGKSAPFAALLAAAAQVTPPSDPVLKTPAQFKLVGTQRVSRLDARAKSTGQGIYTQDLHLPNMLTAMVAHAPRFGGKVKSFDATAAKKVAGVVDVFQIPTGVAVVAKNTWAAKKGREALKVEWDDSAAETRSSDAIAAEFKAIAHGEKPVTWASFEKAGEPASAFADEAKLFTADMSFPLLSHAPMEPMNCCVELTDDGAHLRFASQGQTFDQMAAAEILGLTPEKVTLDTLPAGGSFGRRATAQSDYVRENLEIAKRIGKGHAVKLVWTREDDMAGGFYRPMSHHRVRVAVAPDGYPAAWEHRLVGNSIAAGTALSSFAVQKGVDTMVAEGAQGSPYFKAIPVVDAQIHHPPSKISALWLRSVGATHNAMAMEHLVDQLAARAKIDPVDYRRELYRRAKAESHLAVLNLAAEKAGWGKPLEKGRARGVAVHECFGSTVANIAEVSMVDGEPRVHRVVVAVDCGFAVAPDQVVAQMEGGVMYGLSFALFGEVKLADGVVQTTNFDSYRVLRHTEAPVVEVHILPSDKPPQGVGEPGTPVVGPAVANALLTLTGKPVTALPIVKSA